MVAGLSPRFRCRRHLGVGAVKSPPPGYYTADERATRPKLIHRVCPRLIYRELLRKRSKRLRSFPLSTHLTTRPCLLTKATQNNEFDKVDVLVATPLRLKSLIEKRKCNLSFVEFLVLDEADKLFEMGFVEQVDAAVAALSLIHI